MDFSRAAASGLLVAGITAALAVATGQNVDVMVCALDGGIMMGATVVADKVAQMLPVTSNFPPSVVAAGVYTAAQAVVRGDNNYLINAAVGGAADMFADKVTDMMPMQSE